jgi:LmbE family N-acetylglucosaminyl deacetylase
MRALFIYPHPDDESFGPGPALASLLRRGHEVFLLTLTRGGATRQRHKYGYSVEEMGEVRFREMQEVARVLGLTGMTVLDLPDSGLKEIDVAAGHRALDCYVTFRETIKLSGARTILAEPTSFEFFDERFDPPVSDLFAGLIGG